jgi:hypothetical protein
MKHEGFMRAEVPSEEPSSRNVQQYLGRLFLCFHSDDIHMLLAEGLGYWDNILTPHPYNRRIPVELEIPTAFAIDPKDFTAVLANTFYDRPSSRMLTVGVTGSHGKSTVAWIMRSVLEQAGLLTGMVSTIEDSIAAERLTMRGDFWESEKEDLTFNRHSSSPFSAAPYEGKYEKICTTPDHIAVRASVMLNFLAQSPFLSSCGLLCEKGGAGSGGEHG